MKRKRATARSGPSCLTSYWRCPWWSHFLWAKGFWGVGVARPLVRRTQHCRSPVLLTSRTRRPTWGPSHRATELGERCKELNSTVPAARLWFPFPPFLRGVGLVFQGCCIKWVAHTGWDRTREIRFQLWRPEDWNERVTGSSLLLASDGGWRLQHASASSHVTLTPASVTWRHHMGLYLILQGHQLYQIWGSPFSRPTSF